MIILWSQATRNLTRIGRGLRRLPLSLTIQWPSLNVFTTSMRRSATKFRRLSTALCHTVMSRSSNTPKTTRCNLRPMSSVCLVDCWLLVEIDELSWLHIPKFKSAKCTSSVSTYVLNKQLNSRTYAQNERLRNVCSVLAYRNTCFYC